MKLLVDGQAYEFDQGRFMVKEARLIKAATGLTLTTWQEQLGAMDADAVAALVWLLRRRNGETDLRYEDVDFDLGSLKIEGEDEADPTNAPAADATSATA